MADNKVSIIISVVALLGLLSFCAGFGAEFTKAKASEIAELSTRYECVYPKTPAMELGLTAAVSLLVAQIIVHVSAGCFCCKNIRTSNWSLRLFCVFSWITFFIAIRMLLAGAAFNDGMVNGNDTSYFGYIQCYYVKPGVFASGAVLSAVSVAFGISYLVSVFKCEKEEANSNPNNPNLNPNFPGGIPMAQPQFPPQYNNNMAQPQFPPQYNNNKDFAGRNA